MDKCTKCKNRFKYCLEPPCSVCKWNEDALQDNFEEDIEPTKFYDCGT